MSNARGNENLSHEEHVSENTEVLRNDKSLNELRDDNVPDVEPTNANEDTETVRNQSKQVGKRVTDWSFLKRVGKKRKCGFKVCFF